jgi:hypothetical protein
MLPERARAGEAKTVEPDSALATTSPTTSVSYKVEPHDYIVPAPISGVANTVLQNLVTQCAVVKGHWEHDMGPGCPAVFGTMFGYVSGVRRNRADLIRLGRITAAGESITLGRELAAMAAGRGNPESQAIAGFPALLLSGSLGGRSLDRRAFSSLIGPMIQEAEASPPDPLEDTSALLAVLLAELHRVEPVRDPTRLEKARLFARRVEARQFPTRQVMAYAAVARASRVPSDVAEATTKAKTVLPTFARRDGDMMVRASYPDYLSHHLALIHALSDLTQLQPKGPWRKHALEILDYVFSTAYFDGRFLVHDRLKGGRSDDFCSGCNFWALYLADRLYGDTLLLETIPKPVIRNR